MSVVIPTYGQAAANLNPGAAPQRLASDVGALAPLATTYHAPQQLQYSNYVAPTSAKGSNLSQFGHFIGGLAHQTGSIVAGATDWLAHQTVQLATSPVHYTEGIYRGLNDRSTLAGIDAQSADLSGKFTNLNSMYKSGGISSAQYKAGLADINKATDGLVTQSKSINTKIASDQKQAYQSTIDTSSAILTLLTAGVGGYASKVAASGAEKLGAGDLATMTAGNYLKSRAAGAYLATAEKAIGHLAGNGEEFSKLGTVAQTAIQKATAEVVATGANLSAPQIARTAAVNLALKYPIYYNLISHTGDQIYTELQAKKYGDAVNTVAFNAALVLSGGPIGQAVKYLGKFAKGAVSATFGQNSFVDIVDKELFGGEGKLYQVLKDNPEAAQAMSNMRATHMSVTGNDDVAAAWRLINGERAVAGDNYVAHGPEAWIQHLIGWNSEQKAFSATAKQLGLPNVVMAPWTANSVNMISEHLAQFPKEQWGQAFKDLQAQFPDSAWANNQNVIGRVEHAIATSADNTELLGNIKSIDAGKFQSGFPSWMVRRAAQSGLTPIEAAKGAQVFKEGTGPLVTKFAGETGTLDTKIPVKGTTTLGQALPDSPIFQTHPYLKDVTIKYGGKGIRTDEAGRVLHAKGAYLPSSNTIVVAKGLSPEHRLAAIRHEVQHVIQVSEGRFAGEETSKLSREEYLAHPAEAEARQAEQKYVQDFTPKTPVNNEFFTRAVQPLPVLSTVGALLRGMGLSPLASSERTYQLFNENVSANLEKTSAASTINARLGEKAAPKVVAQSNSVFSAEELKNLQAQGFTPETIGRMEKGQLTEGALPASQPAATETAPTKQVSATDYMLKRLSSYAHNPTRTGLATGRPVQDLRQLTNKDIQTVLKVSKSQATEIQNAITLAHIQVPLAVKGLGDRAVDAVYATPGLRAISRRFLKTQGILRFGANPFFQYLRVIPKTEILSASEGGGFIKTLWNGQGKEINATRDFLRSAGLLDEVGHLGNVTGAEAVDQLGVTGGKNLSKKLLATQEKSIAGIIIDQAKRMNMSTEDYIAAFPDKAKDTIQMIAEYDKKSSFLNSPLARTLNVAVFPFRFDAKVLTIMGRNLAKTDLFTQVAFVKGMMGAHDWLNSPQGQAWYQQNADAIGLFKYITPFANFNEIFHSLLPGNDHSLGNFGQLGGLPFGWIPSILDSEGLTQFNQPGVDAKTGQPFTKYIPKDSRGQVATAIQDMLSQMFSYPGATVGLPSKNKATLALAEGVTGAKSKDFTKTTPPGGKATVAAPYNSYGPLQSATVPATATPINQVHVKPPKTSSRLRVTKKKKSQFTPQLLPGQSQLGQL